MSNLNQIKLRPFHPDDAETVLSWCKDKQTFRLWSADRYKDFPAQPHEMMEQYDDCYMYLFNNPFMIWGRYRKRCFRYELPISFQFHHAQMDGGHAGKFLANLQEEINRLNFPDSKIF